MQFKPLTTTENIFRFPNMPCTKYMSQGSEDLGLTKNLCLFNLTGTGKEHKWLSTFKNCKQIRSMSMIYFVVCRIQLKWYWKVHHSSWPLWPCRYMEVIDWCTSSPSLGSWEIPLWCIHQSGTLSTKMNPKAMTLHISPSLSQDHGIIFCLFTFSRFSPVFF